MARKNIERKTLTSGASTSGVTITKTGAFIKTKTPLSNSTSTSGGMKMQKTATPLKTTKSKAGGGSGGSSKINRRTLY